MRTMPVLLAAATLAACAQPQGPKVRVFTGGRVELGYRADGDPYRRVTFEECERPDQVRLGAPNQRLLELAIMMPDGRTEEADAPTLQRLEAEEIEIRVFEDRIDYAAPSAPVPADAECADAEWWGPDGTSLVTVTE